MGTNQIDLDIHGFDPGGPAGNLDAVRHFDAPNDLRHEIVEARLWAGCTTTSRASPVWSSAVTSRNTTSGTPSGPPTTSSRQPQAPEQAAGTRQVVTPGTSRRGVSTAPAVPSTVT